MIFTSMVRRIEKEHEEAVRRLLVAVAKRAGTVIRKEELKRQAITAAINKPFAQEIKNEIEKIINTIPNPEEILEKIFEKTKEGAPILDVTISELIEGFMEALPAAVTGVIDRIPDLIDDTNNLIETANRILEELDKEGIYTPKLKPIMLTDEEKKDFIKLSSKLRLARERLETIIEFFGELEKYSVDSNDK